MCICALDQRRGNSQHADLRGHYLDYDRYRLGTWGSLGAGAALAIIGGLLLELSRRSRARERPVRAGPLSGGSGLTVQGRF